MSETELTTPVEIDTTLADLYYETQRILQRIAREQHTLLSIAGAKYYYRGRTRVTDMKAGEARSIVSGLLAKHATDSEYARLDHGYSVGQARDTMAQLNKLAEDLATIRHDTETLERLYTGWSRFHVVTSSTGHIHSSMHCTSCYATTTYGWLPELSDKSQAEAIEYFGPFASALCSVCFPDAPVDSHRTKLSQADAEKFARGEKVLTADEKRAAKEAAKREKEMAKIPRQHAQALKVNELYDAFGDNVYGPGGAYEATYPGERFGKGYDIAFSIYSDLISARSRRAR